MSSLRRLRSTLAAMGAAALVVGGCAHALTEADARAAISYHRLSDKSKAILESRVLRLNHVDATDSPVMGSAILLDDGRVLTSLHCLAELNWVSLQAQIDGQWRELPPAWINGYELNGRQVALLVESKGGADPLDMPRDWAICQVKPEDGEWLAPGETPDFRILPGAMPAEGTPVWMVGYWNPQGDPNPTRPNFVAGFVTTHGKHKPRENLFSIDCSDALTVLGGTSGGAVAKIEPDGSVVVMGVYRGGESLTRFGIKIGASQVAVLVPPLER